jgi:hypothetical protein
MTVPKAVNPYAVGRKPMSKQSTAIKPKPPVPAGRVVEKNNEKNAPKSAPRLSSQQPVLSAPATSGTKTKTKTAKIPPVLPQAAIATKTSSVKGPPSNVNASLKPAVTLSLKAKLKRDIENLKRAKLLQKQRVEEEKQRKILEKQKRKQQAAELQKKMEENAKAPSVPVPVVAEKGNNVEKPTIQVPVSSSLASVQTQTQTLVAGFHQAPSVYPTAPTSFPKTQTPVAGFHQAPSVMYSNPPPSFSQNPSLFRASYPPPPPPTSFLPTPPVSVGWNRPMIPVHMSSQHQLQQQQPYVPPTPAFAASQHVTPSPATGISKQLAYYATTTSTTATATTPASMDKTVHHAASRIHQQVPVPVPGASRIANDPVSPNHYLHSHLLHSKDAAAASTKNDQSLSPNVKGYEHIGTTMQMQMSSTMPKHDVASTKVHVVDHTISPDVSTTTNLPSEGMETNVAATKTVDQSLSPNLPFHTATATATATVPAPLVKENRETTAAPTVEELANTKKNVDQSWPEKPTSTPTLALQAPLSETTTGTSAQDHVVEGGQAAFVPQQPMQYQYSTPNPVSLQHYPMGPSVPTAYNHPAMNYGGYHPYANLYQNVQQAWGMQQHQQQLQHFYPPTAFQQPPISYSMPSSVPFSLAAKPPPPPPRPVVSKPPTPKRGAELLAHALEVPSPFVSTHELLPFTVTIVKKPGESFGVTIKAEIESALVEPEWLERLPGGEHKQISPVSIKNGPAAVESKADAIVAVGKTETETEASAIAAMPLQSEKEKTMDVSSSGGIVSAGDAKVANTQKVEDAKPRRARRRRVFFAALAVVNPTIQNQRLALPDPSKMLMQGDILLVINGIKTAGRTFKEACALFASCNQVANDGMVHCTVTVARRKTKPVNVTVPPVTANLLVALPTTGPAVRELDVGPLKPSESSAFANALLKAVLDSKRLLGRPVADSLLRSVTSLEPALSSRYFPTLKDSLSNASKGIERLMTERARNYWEIQWKNEPTEVKLPGVEFLTDAQRSTMRAAPRPPKGCRCGKIDHEYCHDHRCPLFSDVRAADPVSAESMANGSKRTLSKLPPRDLNTVETAFKDRFVRLQAEKEAQETEARFVARMEDIQVKKHSKAVFAPSLAAMVLCTVVELEADFKNDVFEPLSPVVASETSRLAAAPTNANDSDEDSDDEDVPLAALGKRTQNDSNSLANKKQKAEMFVRRKFLAKLIQSISKKWGHVYREPSDVEYAW